MAGITLAQAEANLNAWVAASEAAATGKSYTIGNRSLTRADAKDILVQIDYWQARVDRLSAGGSGGRRMRGGTPI